MKKARIQVESLVIPTYPEPEKEQMPIFSEHRGHQRSSGRPYPNKVTMEVDREHRADRTYAAVHLENDYLDVWVLPQIGGRIFAAQDKTTGYDFFYRQHVIKPGLIGALGSWISGGVEFNWPYHHRPSGFMPCDYELEETEDGSVICWLSEHDPIDRMKGMVGVVVRPEASYVETRVKLCNRTPMTKSFLWWENAAVPVNENYQIFFPHDVTYVNFHYLDSRISYPIAGDDNFNGIDMSQARDISWHKNSREATSYFACASAYDFFGGYDHGRECGVVHIGDHHISPGKKMFTWGYNQLSKTWETTLTDTDGQYAELMASSYSDNQPNFSWLEPYETKEFSQFWYPISRIGTPDYANLSCAVSLKEDRIWLEATEMIGPAVLEVYAGTDTVLRQAVTLETSKPVMLPWQRSEGLLRIQITDANGSTVVRYTEETPDHLKKPPIREPMPMANELLDADELYRAGVHVEQYRDPAVMPDAYWLEALKRNPRHADSLLAMAGYCYRMARPEEAKGYAEKAIESLTQFNERTQSGECWYQYALILEELGRLDEAYDNYYKACWNGSAIAKAMARLACLDLRRGDYRNGEKHARQALARDAMHPLAPAALIIALKAQGREAEAARTAEEVLNKDCLNMLVRWLSGMDRAEFFGKMESEPAQTVLDLVFDLELMGQYGQAAELLEELIHYRPEQKTVMICYSLAYFRALLGSKTGDLICQGDGAPLGNAYPVRLGEIRVLRFAMEQGSVHAPFLLGCLLYDKRQYARAAELFARGIELEPDNYMAYRSLAVAYCSHLNRQDEALGLMEKAMSLHYSQQLLYETVTLMDLLGTDPNRKIALLEPYVDRISRDDLFVELAKAYNQNSQPGKVLELLKKHVFVACEGGEHAIADQYMYAWFQLGAEKKAAGDYAGAVETFTAAFTLPKSLGSGIWNRCKYVPYQFQIAQCLEKLGDMEQAREIYRQILDIQIDSFSSANLMELPYYQAMSAQALGLPQRAWNIMGRAKREWTAELGRTDDGFFTTTPFFVSFVQKPEILRHAQYTYLLGLVRLYEGRAEQARAMFRESYGMNSDNLFCHFYAGHTN